MTTNQCKLPKLNQMNISAYARTMLKNNNNPTG